MSNEVYAFALKSTLNEIKNVCPDISHSLIFEEGAKILVTDEDTNQTNAVQAADALNAIIEKADPIGGIESITIQTEKSRINLICTNGFYSATVASKESNEEYVNTLTKVLVPTVLKLVEKVGKESLADNFLEVEQPEPAAETEKVDEESEPNPPQEEIVPIDDEPEPFIPEPMATQFMIENIGGLLVHSDTVNIDNAVILQWNDTYEDKKINEVEIETLTGQTTRCKFKPIKDAKHNGKGVIRMPKKIQLTLQASQGELVMVKPVVE